jgi:hypothetical protein
MRIPEYTALLPLIFALFSSLPSVFEQWLQGLSLAEGFLPFVLQLYDDFTLKSPILHFFESIASSFSLDIADAIFDLTSRSLIAFGAAFRSGDPFLVFRCCWRSSRYCRAHGCSDAR